MENPTKADRPALSAPSRWRFGRLLWRDPNTQFLSLAVLVGFLGALVAIAFRFLTGRLTALLTGQDDIVAGALALPTALRVVIPASGAFLGGVIARAFVRTGGTMGIAQIMEVVAVGRRTVRFRQSAARTAASALVISSGGSEGREGSILQMAAAFASLVARWVRVSPERAQVLVACGMAAGVAGAYNTPISATLFVIELIVGSFSVSLFGPVVVSSVISAVVTRGVLGNAPLYRAEPFKVGSARELLPYLAVGLLTGVGSVFFMRALRLGKRAFQATGMRDEYRMALGGMGVGALGLVLPQVWGNGFEGTNQVLTMAFPLWFLLLLCLAKVAATSLTIGSGGVGGVFTPALMVGATLGAAIGTAVQAVGPDFSAPVSGYALLGMGGLLAGTTRAPFLSIIMMFELTDNPEIVLPMMIVSVLAIVGARLFERESIYVQELREAGVQWQDTPQGTALASLKVRDVMRAEVPLVPETLPLTEVVKTFMETRSLYLYVADAERKLQGVVDLHDVKDILREESLSGLVIAGDIVQEIPFVLPSESLASVNEKLWFRDYGQLPVVESAEGRTFLGIVTRRDLLGALDREILRRNTLMARIRRFADQTGEMDYFELPEKHRLLSLDVPPELYGKTLSEAGLRQSFGISVLAVRRLGRDGVERRFVPEPGEKLQRGDQLVVLATDEAIERFRRPTPSGVRT